MKHSAIFLVTITLINVSADYEENISQNYEVIKHMLQQLQRHYSATKFYTKFEALFSKDIDGNTKEFGFYSKMMIMLQASNIDDLVAECKLKTAASIDAFASHGSGWIFKEFTSISLHVTKYTPLAGGSCAGLSHDDENYDFDSEVYGLDDDITELWKNSPQ